MTDLAKWMQKQGVRDRWVAGETGISRSEINRLRRGKVWASAISAIRLEQLTGISWRRFVPPVPTPKQSDRKA